MAEVGEDNSNEQIEKNVNSYRFFDFKEICLLWG